MPLTLIPDRIDALAAELLRAARHEVLAPGQLSRAQTLAIIPRATALLIRSATRVDAELLRAARQLRVVVRAGSGVDNVDLAAATAQGVVVMNTPGANTLAVAEFTIGLLIALARNIPQSHLSLGEGKWERPQFTGIMLSGKTLGLYGYGRVGQAVAVRAKAFGMRVLAYDPFLPATVFAEQGVKSVPLAELWAAADFLSLHAEVNEGNCGIVNEASIVQMKAGVRIVNTARAALIDLPAIEAALAKGQVGGLATDVYDPEPPPAIHFLLQHPSVIHTPHLAASAAEVQREVARAAAETILLAVDEGRYQNVCNPAVLA